jgi:hypothetical protein
MKSKNAILAFILTLCITMAFGQGLPVSDPIYPTNSRQAMNLRHSLGSSLFLLGNFDSGKPVNYIQLHYGYQLAPNDNIVVEANTWTYYEPLGTYGNSEEMYPGKVRAYGVGVGYQRFLWNNAYTSVVVTPFIQQFYDSNDEKIQKGFQLYLQFIAGYRFEFFHKRWFLEPAFALKYWPVNTNFPASFEAVEEGAPNYKFEPSANFGYRF